MSCGVDEHFAVYPNLYHDYNSIVFGRFNPKIKKDMGVFSLLDNYFTGSRFSEFISKSFSPIIFRRFAEAKFSNRDYFVLGNNVSSLLIYRKY